MGISRMAGRWRLAQVTNACADIKSNSAEVVYAIAIFNEPEDELTDTSFFNDPNIGGSTQSQRMNYVWSQTFKVIRALIPGIKIMWPPHGVPAAGRCRSLWMAC